MAKDDYDVIVFKILLYYYAVLKRKIVFEDATFEALIDKQDISKEYFTDVLHMMKEKGLIENLSFMNAWGGDLILVSDLKDIKITHDGVQYLKENEKMKKVKNLFLGVVDLTSKLIQLVLLAK
ncbi:MAG: YjcQ family protein [Clostridia bacterium]|nr:YjcQ family protein [Clostridia bacterium]